ncbi:hypothetical protein ACIGG9_28420 [Pseudonocardia alni]|uniref:hypothetical protein n=1 Tax=Pseudonocardia alni TaxID=33907 RepID=UPI00340AD6B0
MPDQDGPHPFGVVTRIISGRRSAASNTADGVGSLHEPPLSIGGSVPTVWTVRYDREISGGRTAAALLTAVRGLHVDPVMSRIPHVAAPLLELLLRRERTALGDVRVLDLVPTSRYDVAIDGETADRLD